MQGNTTPVVSGESGMGAQDLTKLREQAETLRRAEETKHKTKAKLALVRSYRDLQKNIDLFFDNTVVIENLKPSRQSLYFKGEVDRLQIKASALRDALAVLETISEKSAALSRRCDELKQETINYNREIRVPTPAEKKQAKAEAETAIKKAKGAAAARLTALKGTASIMTRIGRSMRESGHLPSEWLVECLQLITPATTESTALIG